MMKNKTLTMTAIMVICLLSACSPINSMAPFDDHQAAIVARAIAAPAPSHR